MKKLEKATEQLTKVATTFRSELAKETVKAITGDDLYSINQIIGCIDVSMPDLSASELLVLIKNELDTK